MRMKKKKKMKKKEEEKINEKVSKLWAYIKDIIDSHSPTLISLMA
jgi:hypothetical protein